MKKIISFFKWLIDHLNLFAAKKPEVVTAEVENPGYRIEYVEDVPELIRDKIILIVQDGNDPELLVFKCPCGCDLGVSLNLLEDARPKWNFNFNDDGTMDVYPSIWRTVGCKSHFWLKASKIKWV